MSAAVGDIAGSAYEGRSHRTKDYDSVKMFSSRAHFRTTRYVRLRAPRLSLTILTWP